MALRLPPPEDANAIQVSVQRVQTALIDGTISAKTAGLLLYSLQLAMTNVVRTTFGQADDDELVREVVDEEEALKEKALSTQQSAITKNQTQNQTFETQRNGGSGGAEGLPRIDADERELDEEEEEAKVVTMRM